MWHLVDIPVTWFWRSKGERPGRGFWVFRYPGLILFRFTEFLCHDKDINYFFSKFFILRHNFFYVNVRCHSDRNMLTKSSHGLGKEGICGIRLAWPNCSESKVIQFIWVCCFSANCLIIPISSKLNQYCLMKPVWSTVLSFEWLSVCENIEGYIPVLVIGSDRPPKPKKN